MKSKLFKAFAITLGMLGFWAACTADLKNLDSNKKIDSETIDDYQDLDIENNYEKSDSCVTSSASHVDSIRPVDVIFVIDNSGSMSEEIQLITQNINDHFAAVMDAANLDYRVIVIVQHGSPSSYYGYACFEEPLSTIPKGDCENLTLGTPPGNKYGKFYHYSYDVQSNDSPCIILDTLFAVNNRPDKYGLAPEGWIKWLRKSAYKIIIEVTDDAPSCWWYPDVDDTTKKKVFNDFQSELGGQIFAIEFDKKLTTLAPEQFGTPEKRNYTFYSIVGMKEKPDAVDEEFGSLIDPLGKENDPFLPSEAVASNKCSTAAASGFGYQSLSKLTGGLRFPVCQAEYFDIIFNKLAQSIDSITSTLCILNIPENNNIDFSKVSVEVETEAGVIFLNQVDNEKYCSSSADEFYIDDTSNSVILCENACLNIKSISKNITFNAGCIEQIF